MVKRWHVTLALVGVAALLLGAGASGCGEPDAVSDKDAVLRLDMTEFRISPQNIRVQATRPYQRVVVVARNLGKLTHNIVIEPEEITDAQGINAKRVDPPLQTPTAQPGQTVRQTRYLRPGTYRIKSSITNQENLGMYGRLTIVAR